MQLMMTELASHQECHDGCAVAHDTGRVVVIVPWLTGHFLYGIQGDASQHFVDGRYLDVAPIFRPLADALVDAMPFPRIHGAAMKPSGGQRYELQDQRA